MGFDKKGSGRIATVLFVFSFLVTLSSLNSGTALAGTALGDLAASMQPGTWATLTTTGLNTVFKDITCGNAKNIIAYSDFLLWDSAAQKMRYIGGAHNVCTYNIKWRNIEYNASTNTWSVLGAGSEPSWQTITPARAGQSYDTGVIDVANRRMYVRTMGDMVLRRYNIDSDTWTDRAAQNVISYSNCCVGMAWFPERNSIIYFSVENGSNAGIAEYTESDNAWHRIGTQAGYALGGNVNLDHIAEYNPVYHIVLVGGGDDGSGNYSHKLWKVDASGGVTALHDAPMGIALRSSVVTVDPVSGKFLVLADGRATGGMGPQFWQYDITQDSVGPNYGWAQLPAPPAGSGGVWNTTYGGAGYEVFAAIGGPISTYGVIMFVTCEQTNGDDCRVNLYKHSTSSGTPPPSNTADTTAPSVPTNLNSTVASSSQINLSWTASTDNVGVTGYRVERCPGSGCTNFTQIATPTTNSYSDIGLSSNATYNYRVRAFDAAGNVSGYSSLVSATTASASVPPPSAALTFADKCAQSGVINCFNFDSGFPLYYVWDPYNEPACNSLGTGYGFSDSNRSGPGNTIAHQQNGVCYYPFIDTSVRHSGTGSLKLTVPSLSTEGTGGGYTEVFRRPDFPYIAPGSALGNVVYMQWYQYFDTNFINNVYKFTSGSGSWKQIIWFGNPPNGHSSSSLEVTHVNRRQKNLPTMYGQQGIDDYGYQDVRGCSWAAYGAPYYPNDNNWPEPPCIKYKANQWMEFSVRIEVRGNPNDAASRVQLWIDGQLAIDYPNAKINWGPNGDGDGIGQFLLTTFMTAKDPTYAQPEAHTWFDDLIISTQPIGMSTSTVATSAPAAPSGLVLK